ncbi:MAG: hypothetical protein ABJG15_10975 [Hyphomonadaceae bacterium]
MSDIPMILDRVGKKLAIDVSPHLEGHYAGGHVIMSGLLTMMAAEQFDGLVDRLLSEIGDMRTLLHDGGEETADTRARSFKVSAVQAVHNKLSEQIIKLQERIERSDEPDDKALNARIWTYFREGAEARMPTMPDFTEARAEVLAELERQGE